jgi:hypothetical protein
LDTGTAGCLSGSDETLALVRREFSVATDDFDHAALPLPRSEATCRSFAQPAALVVVLPARPRDAVVDREQLAEVFVGEVVLLQRSWICLRIFITFRALCPAHAQAQERQEVHWLADEFSLHLPAIQKTRRS